VLAPAPVADLADNAVRYNVPNGRVEITTGTRAGRTVLRAVNTGPLVPAGQIRGKLKVLVRTWQGVQYSATTTQHSPPPSAPTIGNPGAPRSTGLK
jgi:hypothetical protein